MAYRLSLDEPVGADLRRCAAEELAGAVAALDGPDRGAGVHDARKAIKKTRALLRLARPGLPRSAYRAENAALRDAARHLAQTRDADVMVATLDDLARRFAGRVPASVFERARASLAAGPASSGDDAAGAAIRDARLALGAVAARVPSWPLERCELGDLLQGAQDAYQRGRREWRQARRAPTAEALHEWRKRVKDLWYHQRLLRELWPTVLKAQAQESKRLSELLGDDHDLAVLAERLEGDGGLGLPAAQAGELRALVEERRAQLQRDAASLAARIYAEGPGAFGQRLAAWAAAR